MRGFVMLCLTAIVALSANAQRGRVYTSLEEITTPDSVYHLSLKRNKLKEFPQAILQLKNLE